MTNVITVWWRHDQIVVDKHRISPSLLWRRSLSRHVTLIPKETADHIETTFLSHF